MPLVQLIQQNRHGKVGDEIEMDDATAAHLVCVGEAFILRYDETGPGANVSESISHRAPKEIQDAIDEGADPPSRRPPRRGR